MKRRTDGFTLLEVLAAVAILGIWFVVLASVAIQGLRAEGTNERRIRASLLADTVLSEIELGLASGQVPEEVEESERDDFLVGVEVVPLAELEAEVIEGDLRGMLEAELPELNQALYAIDVQVSWLEAEDEQKLTRSTYGWDAAALLESLGAADLPPGEPGERTQSQQPRSERSTGRFRANRARR